MSDFAGLWRLDGRPVDHADLTRLSQGLDGHTPPRIWKSREVLLVQRQHHFTPEDRLDQLPGDNGTGSLLLADLRLDHPSDLAARLSAERPAGDGGLMQQALARWGCEASLSQIDGDFAFAWWQPAARRLTLARDHGGWRNLFFHFSPGLVAFSNRLRCLLSLPEISRELDEEALADFMVLAPEWGERTIYPSIRRLPKAHLAEITPDGVTLRRWWQPPEPGSLRFPSETRLLEEAHAVLDDAVSSCLRSDGPPTLFLTGGLDTAAVALSANRLTRERLLTLTRKPDGPVPRETPLRFFDESARAAQTASRLPMLDWQAVSTDGETAPPLSRLFLESGLPTRAPNTLEWFMPMFRTMARAGSRVSLGGEIGNAFFSDTGLALLPQLLRQGRLGRLAVTMLALNRRQGLSLSSLLKLSLRPFEPLPLRHWRRRETDSPWSSHSPISSGFALKAGLNARLDIVDYRPRIGAGMASFHGFRRWLWDDEAAHDAQSAMRALSGTDHRVPLGRRRLVEFFAALPIEEALKDGLTRSLARRMLAGHLPDPVVFTNATGRQLGDWHAILEPRRSAMCAELERLAQIPAIADRLDIAALRASLDNWPTDIEQAETHKHQYQFQLTRGLAMARFLHWHGGGNA